MNNDCNKRGQTSRPVTGAKIQTSCNFKKNAHDPNCCLNLDILGILAYLWDPIVMSWCIKVAVPVCLLTSFVCYVKIFFILRHIQI